MSRRIFVALKKLAMKTKETDALFSEKLMISRKIHKKIKLKNLNKIIVLSGGGE